MVATEGEVWAKQRKLYIPGFNPDFWRVAFPPLWRSAIASWSSAMRMRRMASRRILLIGLSILLPTCLLN
jgi:myosin-crossreactive antigen